MKMSKLEYRIACSNAINNFVNAIYVAKNSALSQLEKATLTIFLDCALDGYEPDDDGEYSCCYTEDDIDTIRDMLMGFSLALMGISDYDKLTTATGFVCTELITFFFKMYPDKM